MSTTDEAVFLPEAAWEFHEPEGDSPMPTTFRAGYEQGFIDGQASRKVEAIAAKMREQNPAPRSDMPYADFVTATGIYALIRALESLGIEVTP